MESKQIWLTAIISLVVALIVSWIVVAVVAKPPEPPQLGPNLTVERVPAPLPLLPDLVITQMSKRSSPTNYSGNTTYTVQLTASVRNIGRDRAGESYTRFVVSSFSFPNISLVGSAFTPAILPNQTTDVSYTYFGLPVGLYTAIGYADEFNMVNESNENNNVYNFTFILP